MCDAVVVISDTALELIRVEGAAAVVHYDIPKDRNVFASRLMTMKSYFSNDGFQQRVWLIVILTQAKC